MSKRFAGAVGVERDGRKIPPACSTNALEDLTILFPVRPLRHNLTADEVPHGLRLRGIQRGYRDGGTHWQCMLTLFTWHNQTLNSWTMVLGWLVSSAYLAYGISTYAPQGGACLAFWSLWACTTIHLPFTLGYHQLLCMSPEHLRQWRARDVTFIFVASTFLAYGLSYYVFPLWGCLLLTALTALLAVYAYHTAHALGAGENVNKHASTKFVGVACCMYLLPLWVQGARDYAASGQVQLPLCAALSAQLCFAYAAVVYCASWPERWMPGVFDMVGASQQLMHLGVGGAHVCEWMFLLHMHQRTLQ